MGSSEEKAPTIHYVYAHWALRDFVFSETDFFLQVFKAGPDNMKRLLVDFWTDLREKYEELKQRETELSENDFDLSLVKVTNGQELMLVKLPEPVKSPEAFYLGILVSDEPRYFTFELGENDFEQGKRFFVVCEWDRDKKHNNYGAVSEMRPGLFVGKIDKVLGKN